MEKINYQNFINVQKNIYFMLCERMKNIMTNVKRMGDYFVNNINHKTVDLYADLFKMQKLNDIINNILKNEYLTYSYISTLSENNMRLDKLVESIEKQINAIIKGDFSKKECLQK